MSPSVTSAVSISAVFLAYSLCTKEEEFYCLQGRSEGFQENGTFFPLFCCVYPTYEQASFHAGAGGCSGNSPVLVK